MNAIQRRLKNTLLWFCGLVLLMGAAGAATQRAGAADREGKPLSHQLLKHIRQAFRGDLPALQKKRRIRVLVSYSRTNFFFDMAKPVGFEYELLHGYENFLNRNVKNRTRRTHLIFIPTSFDRLLKDLAAGRGDIAAAGLTITKTRRRLVSFTAPYLTGVSEIVVTNRKVKQLHALKDLCGQKIYVRRGSSYIAHLEELNHQFKAAGCKGVGIAPAESHLATEDILEMVNAGVVGITVVDSHIAGLWAQVLPDIVVYKNLAVHTGGRIAWAVRKNNPKLRASLDAYVRKNKKGTLLGNMLFKRYYRNTNWVKNPLNRKDRRRLQQMTALFKKYGQRYGFDWLAIAAQAYQESGLQQTKRSPAGAIGVMQIKPRTAADKTVNIRHIERLENNIHAGVKYLNYLRHSYFNDPAITPVDRVYFSWAAYNAGPARISRLRRQGARMGVDPNRWFFNVENVAARYIGRETVDYVANINKYYVAYKLAAELQRDGEGRKQKAGAAAAGSAAKGRSETRDEAPAVLSEKPAKRATRRGADAPHPKRSLKKATRKKTVHYHTVRRGETLYGLARRYGISVDTLRRLNGMSLKTVLKPGARLRVSR